MSTLKETLKRHVKTVKQEIIIANSAMVILGILLIIFPSQSTDVICRITGALLCLWGLFRIIFYFTGDRAEILGSFAMVQGAALFGFGIYFLIFPEILAAFFTVALAILLFIAGIMKLQYALEFMRLKTNRWWVELIGAALMIIGGVIAFVNPFGAAEALMIFFGIALICSGIWDLISVIIISSVLKKPVSSADEKSKVEVINVDYREDK